MTLQVRPKRQAPMAELKLIWSALEPKICSGGRKHNGLWEQNVGWFTTIHGNFPPKTTWCNYPVWLFKLSLRSHHKSSTIRVVDLALNQAAKPWSHQYLDPAWYHLSRIVSKIGDKSAALWFTTIHGNLRIPTHPPNAAFSLRKKKRLYFPGLDNDICVLPVQFNLGPEAWCLEERSFPFGARAVRLWRFFGKIVHPRFSRTNNTLATKFERNTPILGRMISCLAW